MDEGGRVNRALATAKGQVGFLSISQPGTWIVALAGHFGGQKNKEYAKTYYVLCAKKGYGKVSDKIGPKIMHVGG